MANGKEILKGLLGDLRKKKDEEDKVRQKKNDDDRNKILEGVGGDLSKSLQPVLEQLANNAQMNEEQIRNALMEAIQVNMPELDTQSIAETVKNAIFEAFSSLKFPTPVVNVPAPSVNLPEIKIPETKFPDRMSVGLEEYNNKRPLPVMLMDTKGNPFVFSFPAGNGGGKADFLTIKGIQASAFGELVNADGRLKVETNDSGASIGNVGQVSGAVWSTNVVSAFGSTAVDNVFNADNRLRVSVETGGSGLTDSELRASSLPVEQVSGSAWTTYVKEIFGSTATDVVNPDGRLKVELPTGSSGLTDSELRATAVPVSQLSGASWSTAVVSISDIFSTTASSNVVNPDNRVKVEFPATTITGITNTIASANVDSTGVQYSGSNPMPTYLVAGSGNSTVTVGDLASDAADTGSSPVKIGGIARQANPTAVAAGDRVSATFDDLGRQLITPIQVRDLITTAYATLSTNTETTLATAVSATFLDLIWVKFSNTSSGAVTVDLRDGTGGNIVDTYEVPANGVSGISMPRPYPQGNAGNNWTVDFNDSDLSNTTVYVSAMFSREV